MLSFGSEPGKIPNGGIEMKKITCIDVFAGGGGLSEGFHRAGYNIISHIEKDINAALTLKTRLSYQYLQENNKTDLYIKYLKKEISRDKFYSFIPPEILDKVINEEISENTIDTIFSKIDKQLKGEKVDIIIGGPPCQAYSLIGRARDPEGMINDKRNYLYKQYLKFLNKYRPKLFVFENVKGLLSAQKGELFEQILEEMDELGYTADHRVLNSYNFGVPQKRERVIIIGWKKNKDFSYPEFEKNNIENNNINNLFIDLPKLKAGDFFEFGTFTKKNSLLENLNIKNSDWKILTQHIARPHNKNDLKIYEIAVQKLKNGKKLKYNDLPKNLRTQKNSNSFLDRFKVVDGNNVCHTMVAHISKDGHYYIHPDLEQNRSISVREAARIQTFPDDYYFESSRTSAFMQIGNAVPPLMAEKIANKLRGCLKIEI